MFTPGKWTVSLHRGSSGWIDVNCEGLPVASTHGHFSQTSEADARLIAASKDLYQAVIGLLPFAENVYGLKDPKVAAIKKIIEQVENKQ